MRFFYLLLTLLLAVVQTVVCTQPPSPPLGVVAQAPFHGRNREVMGLLMQSVFNRQDGPTAEWELVKQRLHTAQGAPTDGSRGTSFSTLLHPATRGGVAPKAVVVPPGTRA